MNPRSHEPPTEKQLEEAANLDIQIPSRATANDLTDLITLKLTKDKRSTNRHRSFARAFGIEVGDYIGLKALFDKIQDVLVKPGREKELVSWFAYRVYRNLSNFSYYTAIKSPDHPIILEIAGQLCRDEEILESIREYKGRDLMWFGEWTSPAGFLQQGGSDRTEAYRQVASLLQQRVRVAARTDKRQYPDDEPIQPELQPSQLLFRIVAMLAVASGVFASAALLWKILIR